MRLSTIFLALLAVIALPACDGSDHDSVHRHPSKHRGYTVSAAAGSIYVRKNDLNIRSDKASIATIHPDASLSIDGDEVEVSESARKSLNGYRAAYKALAEDAIGLGLDGVDLGLSTMSKVFKGLLDGTADEAGKEADRRGRELDQRARGLCDRLAALRGAQQNVVDAVPKFADYAVISASEIKRCYDDNPHAAAKDPEDDRVDLSDSMTPSPLPPEPPTPPSPPSSKSHSININVDSGEWSVHHGTIVIPKEKGDDAVVEKDGALKIGDDSIAISDTGREALKRYNFNGRHVEDEGVGLGLAGADMALGALGGALRGAFGGDTDASDKELERHGNAINARVARMCGYLRDMRTAQQDALAAIPQFEPYAVITEKGVRDCGIKKNNPSP